jgi:hypothetical protein
MFLVSLGLKVISLGSFICTNTTWPWFFAELVGASVIFFVYLCSGLSCSLSLCGHGTLKLNGQPNIFSEILKNNIFNF